MELQPPLPLPPPAPVDGSTAAATTADAPDQATPSADKAAKLANWSLASGGAAVLIPGVEIAAVTLGVMSLNAIDDESDDEPDDDSDDELTRRKALAGIVLGVLAFLMHLLAVIVLLLMLFYSPQSRQQARTPVPPAPVPSQFPLEGLGAAAAPSRQANTPPPKRTGQAWYYDLNVGQIFTGNSTEVAPIDAPSGPLPDGGQAGVKAYVFSYGDCADESQRFIAWLERAIPNAKKVVEQSRTNPTGAGGNLSVDDWIQVLSGPLEISEDAQSWRSIHPVSYAQWQIQKRQAMVQKGVRAKECQP